MLSCASLPSLDWCCEAFWVHDYAVYGTPVPAAGRQILIRDFWSGLRDRLLADPRFHRFAFRVPGVRRIARRRARALFDLCAGFVYSQVLLACVQLELLSYLQAGARTPQQVADHCDLPPEAAERLLQAAVPLGLVEPRSGGRFGLGYLGAPLLADAGLLALVRHNALFYDDLRDPVGLLRNEARAEKLSSYWAYARSLGPGELPADAVAEYSDLMATTQDAIAASIADAYDFSRHRLLMDVGGGEGRFSIAVARANPQLRIRVADLPAVAARAAEHLTAARLADRADTWGGDFLRDELPTGADIVTLIRVVHDHDDPAAMRLLRNVHQALPPDGVLLIAEQLADTPGAETVGDTYFGLYLWAMGSGRPRSLVRMNELLARAGFTAAREIAMPLPLQSRLLMTRPAAPQQSA